MVESGAGNNNKDEHTSNFGSRGPRLSVRVGMAGWDANK